MTRFIGGLIPPCCCPRRSSPSRPPNPTRSIPSHATAGMVVYAPAPSGPFYLTACMNRSLPPEGNGSRRSAHPSSDLLGESHARHSASRSCRLHPEPIHRKSAARHRGRRRQYRWLYRHPPPAREQAYSVSIAKCRNCTKQSRRSRLPAGRRSLSSRTCRSLPTRTAWWRSVCGTSGNSTSR